MRAGSFRDAVTIITGLSVMASRKVAGTVCRRLSVRAVVSASRRCAATVPRRLGGEVGGRLAAEQHSGARRSADARHEAPPPMAVEVTRGEPRCNCQQDIVRRASNSSPQGLRCRVGGETPRPLAEGAGKWVSTNASSVPSGDTCPRVKRHAESVVRRTGAPAFQSAWPGVQPGQTPGPASSRGEGGGELQPPCGCSFPLFVPCRTGA